MTGWQRTDVRRLRFATAIGATVLLSSLVLAVEPAVARQPDISPVEVSAAVHSDVSDPVRDLVGVAPAAADDKEHKEKDKPLRPLPNQGNALKQPDGALQGDAAAAGPATQGIGFAGIGAGDYGTVGDQWAPPDTNGAVGATQYVQWTNTDFAVFDKATGAIAAGFPKPGNSIWAGFGGGCQTNNDGDPIVQYDKLANRWILTQFSVSTTPYLQCVAVSTTSDATGTYNRYAFDYGSTGFNDYPKLGVWPDGYYISFNIFTGNFFSGSKVCAFDRAKMLTGAAATQQCFQLSASYGGLLPSDLDGTTPPPAGSPNPFLNYGSNRLNRWKFHVDWTNSANTTFSGPTSIPVASFSAACSGGGACIPQPGTSQKLDSLADRLMYRLAYRNFGDHESLVVNQSVTAGTSVGVRWYEVRNPNGTTPTVFQQGTYAPDATYRWMGSIAMDKAGDIAVGYSGSSSSVSPYIGWAGRTPADALGTLSAETIVKSGSGSQQPSLSRWGDYSAMTVDPVDDCTFWYTNEYLKANGTWNWSTWITSFRFPGCGVAQVLTSIDVAPTSASVQTGGQQQFSATAKDQNGQPMNPQPSSFSWTVSGGGTISQSGLFTAGGATGGPFDVKAASGGVTSGAAHVTVTQAPVLTSITVSPASASVQTGGQQQFSATALDQNNQPMSPQPSFTWNVSGGGTISSAGLFTAGGSAGGPFDVTATSGGVTSGPAHVTVTAPIGDFSLTASPGNRSITSGAATTYTVAIGRTNGFNGAVNLVASGLPSGATAAFAPNNTTGSSSTLTVQTASGVRGSFTLTITGTSGSLQHATTVKLTIKR